jgi:hypothetical protein
LFIKVLLAILLFVALQIEGKPHTSSVYSKNLDGNIRVKIVNNMARTLACYIAIDGHKIKFRLLPMQTSKWHSSTHKAYKYTDFSTWCGYIDQYPAYMEYKAY